MLRDIQLPPEYAKGLERSSIERTGKRSHGSGNRYSSKSRSASRNLQAEATKVQQVKQAEGQAQVRVLEAKGEADAMQYTLPLKQKQIEQSRLEAEARKEATVKNAEAHGGSQSDRQQSRDGAPKDACRGRGRPHPGHGRS